MWTLHLTPGFVSSGAGWRLTRNAADQRGGPELRGPAALSEASENFPLRAPIVCRMPIAEVGHAGCHCVYRPI